MTVIPPAWREQLTDKYLVEVLVAVLAVVAVAFGVVVIVTAPDLAHVSSFRQAFTWVHPNGWGLTMVILGAFAIGFLVHSRLAAAVPTGLLALVWVAWSLPIIQSPGFIWTAFVIYSGIAALTMVAAGACLVPRRKG